ncbi:MAG: 3-hydroxyacyl-CoA dehydrogenase family protein [Bacteroidales bacterium]
MNYSERLQNVSVLGAAGKMGSGILLLTAVELADLSLMDENRNKLFILNAIDTNPAALSGLKKYLEVQVLKIAEKKIIQLRQLYQNRADLIDNKEVIDEYKNYVLSLVQTTTRLEAAYDSTLIFEAIKEDGALKTKIFSQIDKNNRNKPWFFTNTSSIPISKLNKDAGLENRIVGFHFYNPPAVQKLVELIKPEHPIAELENFALEFANRLRKVVVPSNDFAGFIGNGHFMRDALYAIGEAEKLSAAMPLTGAIYTINKVSQDFLIRPMGIFQLIDYVGVDVCSFIMEVMAPYFPDENFYSGYLNKLIKQGIKGGQNHDGSQKDGILKYEKGVPVAVYDSERNSYQALSEFKNKADEYLGTLPDAWLPWKTLIKDAHKETKLKLYFADLRKMKTRGAEIALAYLENSKLIALKLLEQGVAANPKDVNTVMLTGFFHAYGPVNEF